MVTIKDVAIYAGVSASTVSRVVNDNPDISEATKKKVHNAMKKLDYTPNLAARSLSNPNAQSIGVVFPPMADKYQMSNPFYIGALASINRISQKKLYTVNTATGDSYEEILTSVKLLINRGQATRFIMLYSEQDDPVYDYLLDNDQQVTVIGSRKQPSDPVKTVDTDNHLLGVKSTEYLLGRGHQTILFVTNSTEPILILDRFLGYQEAMFKHHVVAPPIFLLDTDEKASLFINTLKELKPDAIIAVDDIFALHLMQAINETGLNIPEDLSLLSFNNSPFAQVIHPYLSSFDVNVAELGEMAVKQLVEPSMSNSILVPFKLIERESVIDRTKR